MTITGDITDICFEQRNGHTRTPATPITGVCNSSAPEWLYEDIANAIDINYEQYLVDNPNDQDGDDYFDYDSTDLIGFIKIDGLYEPDESAEYSAIVGPIYTQVVKSKWVSHCAMCSMCYPGQGDIETAGDQATYTLPPDVWGDTEHLEIEEV